MSAQTETTNHDVIVVGAGNGGLTGALNLAKNGKKVLLLEKHNIPGGAGTTFMRGRFEFDVGLHTLWGIGSEEKPGALRKIFQELGVFDKIEFIKQDEIFALGSLGEFLVGFPYEREAYLRTLAKISPEEEESIRAYQTLIDQMADEFYRLYDELGGEITPEKFPLLFEMGSTPGKEVLNKYIKHPLIRMAYSVLDGYTGIPVSKIPFLLLGFLYELNGGHHVKGGAQAISNALIEEFERAGGKVLYHAEVNKIDVQDNRVSGVELIDGRRFEAPSILVNANKIRTYVDFIDPKFVPAKFYDSIKISKPGQSIFGLYIGLNCAPEKVGLKHGINYLTDRSVKVGPRDSRGFDLEKTGSIYMSCYNMDDPEYSDPDTSAITILVGSEMAAWQNLSREEYHRQKFRFAENVIDLLDRFFPGAKEHVEELDISTPLTHARYLGSPGGAIYANSANFTDLIENKLDPRSPIDGLYFCGASVFVGGFNTTYMSGYAVSSLMMKDEKQGVRTDGYALDEINGIEQIKSDVGALQRFGMDPRALKGQHQKAIDHYHPHDIKVRVAEVIDETPSSKRFLLSPVEGVLPPFVAGQYISVAVNIDGVVTRRAYSLASSPSQRAYYEIAVRRYANGFVCDYMLDKVKPSDVLEISPPAGQFIYNPAIHGNELVLIGGGSGITPFMSMVQDLYENPREGMKVDLIYGCASENDVIYGSKLQALADKFEGFNFHLVISEPQPGYNGLTGFITSELIEKLVDNKMHQKKYYLCGPEAMYQFVVKELESLGLDRRSIMREVQTPPNDPSALAGWPEGVSKDMPVKITLMDGREVQGRASEPILNSLERAQITYPSECRAGECSLCRAKVLEGEVFSPQSVALRRSDSAHGYVHLCAAYPTSDVKIQLDA